MAHFAKIENNIVTEVLVTDNDFPNEGYDWLVETFGGTWVQTSYNGNIRKNFAGVGYIYDANLDAFISPQPFASWILDEGTCNWIPPVAMPEDGKPYSWDEETTTWKLIETGEN